MNRPQFSLGVSLALAFSGLLPGYGSTAAKSVPGPLARGSFRLGAPAGTELSYAQAQAVVVQADGKSVVAGTADVEGETDFAAARYLQNGKLDPRFGSGGQVRIHFLGSDYAQAAVLQRDGKLLLGGYTNNSGDRDFALARLTRSGAPDPTFGDGGRVVLSVGGSFEVIEAMALQPDGKIVVLGSSDDSTALGRLRSNGELDTTFGTGGWSMREGATAGAGFSAVRILANRSILIGGGLRASEDATLDAALARYLPDGSPDATFGEKGVVTVDLGGTEFISSLAVASRGALLAAGYSDTDTDSRFALFRFTKGGALDRSFDQDGVAITDMGGDNEWAKGVAVQRNGQIVIAGYVAQDFVAAFALARYNANGKLDRNFGVGGRVVTSFGEGRSAMANGLALQADGRSIAAGTVAGVEDVDERFGVARYTSRGRLDRTFNQTGIVTTPFLSTPFSLEKE